MSVVRRGLVIRERRLKESDKLLTVLTAEQGKMTVYAHGASSSKSKNKEACSLLRYSEFVLKERGDSYSLAEATEITSFFGAHAELEPYALGQYFASLADEFTVFDSPDESILALVLNALWALTQTKLSPKLIKAAFELRIMSEAGFMPEVSGCTVCSRRTNDMIFDIMNGVIYCPDCIGNAEERRGAYPGSGTADILRRVDGQTIAAVRYITEAGAKRVFSFSLDDELLHELSLIAECYLLNHVGHGFTTLNFYKEICRLG